MVELCGQASFADSLESSGTLPDASPRPNNASENSREEALDLFNAYVRGPLQSEVVKSIGHEAHVPYHLCVVAFLPMSFYSLVNTLGCDSGPCETSAKSAGFESVEWYLAAQAFAWLLCLLLTFPLTHPILLRLIRLVMSCSEGHLQTFLAVLCCPIAYAYSYVCGGIIWGLTFVSIQDYSPDWLAALVLYIACLVAQALLLFRSPRPSSGSGHANADSTILRCSCAGRQVVVQWEEVRPMLPPAGS